MKFDYKRTLKYSLIILIIVATIYVLLTINKERFTLLLDQNKKFLTLEKIRPKCNLNHPKYKDCRCEIYKDSKIYVNDNYNKIAKCKENIIRTNDNGGRGRGRRGYNKKVHMWNSFIDNISYSNKNFTSCDPIKGDTCVPNANACRYTNDNYHLSTWDCKNNRWTP